MASPNGEILFLSRSDVERLLDPVGLLDELARAFIEVSGGRTSVPPRVAALTSKGLLAAMPGFLPGAGLELKLVSVFPGNHALGLPSHQALIALFDPDDGRPLVIMDGTHITAVRTAAAATLAVRTLARPEVRTLAVLGAGVQARQHLEQVPRVREFEEIRLAARRPEAAAALAAGDPKVVVSASFEAAVRGADVVCLTTDATEPFLRFKWLAPGAHVSSVGGSPRGAGELDRETVTRGALFVESRTAFSPAPAGAPELVGLDPQSAAELGEVLAGSHPGRTSEDQVTVYKSMGHATEDAAAARMVYDRALAEGAGIRVRL